MKATVLDGTVGDLVLIGQVLQGVDRVFHPGHRQEGGQVSRIGGDDDEGKEPPEST